MAIEKITGIVVDMLKHSDRHNIVTIFDRRLGRVPLLVSAGSGKQARMRNASLMPLTVIQADVNFSASRELQFLGTFVRPVLWKNLYFDPVKSSVAMFISEFVNTYTRQSGPDAVLWDFLYKSIRDLDVREKGVANFHLAFLIEFMEYSGIRPDLTGWRDDRWFDMQGGTMTDLPPAHRNYLTPSESAVLPILGRMNLRNAGRYRFAAGERRLLLKRLLHYYSLHFPGMANMKSPSVLAEVFGG